MNESTAPSAARKRGAYAGLPSVDRVLAYAEMATLVDQYGRTRVVGGVRTVLAELRAAADGGEQIGELSGATLGALVGDLLIRADMPKLKTVFNLTGTVLHTNLGRALLPDDAIAAVAAALARPCNLEFDLDAGQRGDRDDLVEGLLRELTGAEAATVVNNNAAAVYLCLNTLALRREVIVSRGELIEIGGAFRIPDIMSRAGAKLVEVGTTNRTHLRDFEGAISARTALLLKVHTSNYAVEGFTATVPAGDLCRLARERDLPLMEDLGSGTLADLSDFGLPHEPTPQESLAAGVDVVSFSGDKLLGGPQAGIIVGRADLIAKLRKNPLKRALRVGKETLAALEAVLRLYRDPEHLACRLTTLRLLTRDPARIAAQAARLREPVAKAVAGRATVEVHPCKSQIGSGSLPVDLLDSAALVIAPERKGRGAPLAAIEADFRALPRPVIGRIQDGALWLDLRCLEEAFEDEFAGQLTRLAGH